MFQSPVLSFQVGGDLPSVVLSGLPPFVVAGTQYSVKIGPTSPPGVSLTVMVTCSDADTGALLPGAVFVFTFDAGFNPQNLYDFPLMIPQAPVARIQCQVTEAPSAYSMRNQMIPSDPVAAQVVAQPAKVTLTRPGFNVVYPGSSVTFNARTSAPVGTGGIVLTMRCLLSTPVNQIINMTAGASIVFFAAIAGATGADSCSVFVSGGAAQSQFDSFVAPVALTIATQDTFTVAPPAAAVGPGSSVSITLTPSSPVGSGGVIVTVSCAGVSPGDVIFDPNAANRQAFTLTAPTFLTTQSVSCSFTVNSVQFVAPSPVTFTVLGTANLASSGGAGATSSTGQNGCQTSVCGAMHAATAPSVFGMAAAAAILVALWGQ